MKERNIHSLSVV